MADDFEKAVLFSFDQSGAVDQRLKEQALGFLENTKQVPNVWQLCLERFTSCGYQEVKFWCLQTLQEVLQRQYEHMAPPEQQQVRATVASWLAMDCADATLPSFVKNKIVQIVMVLLRVDYPANWPMFFQDLIGMLGRPGMDDVFSRILLALDDEVISMEVARTGKEQATSMRVKDAMRESCIGMVVDSVRELVITNQARAPELGASLLEGLSRYIIWVDIELVASERMMSLYVGAMGAASPALRSGSLECILAIVGKRMDSTAKMHLIQQLGLVEMAVALSATPEPNPDVALKVTNVLTALAQELLESWRKGSADCPAHLPPVPETTVVARLDKLFPPILARLQDDDQDVSAATLPLINQFVMRIKRLDVPTIPPMHVAQLQQILYAVAQRCRFPEGYKYETGSDAAAMEMEEQVSELRGELFTIFRNVTKLVPEEAYKMVGTALAAVLQPAADGKQISFVESEMVLTLLYELGTGISDEVLKPGSGALANLVSPLLASTNQLPSAMHRLVAVTYMEVVVRYVRVLQQSPQCIGTVLGVFLGEQGLQHPCRGVSGRACYLFMRLVKAIRGQLGLYMETVMSKLATALPPIMDNSASRTDDHLYLFEAAGYLIGFEEIASAEMQHAYLAAMLDPLRRRVEAALGACTPGDEVGPPSMVDEIQRSVYAMAHLSKGFTTQLVNVQCPSLGQQFQEALETALSVLVRLPANRILRARISSFLHRMVDCLATRVFPLLHSTLSMLLASSEVTDLSNILQLLNQLTAKFKGDVGELLADTLEPMLARMDVLLVPVRAAAAATGAVPNTEANREANELKQNQHLLLNTMANVALLPLVLTSLSRARLESLLDSLVVDAGKHAEPATCKLCVSTLRYIVAEWCGGASEAAALTALPGLHQFVVQRVGIEVAMRTALVRTLNVRDANGAIAFGELVALQRLLYERAGAAFLAAAQAELLQMGFPPDVVQQYSGYIQGTDMKLLKGFVKRMWEEHQKGTR